MYETKGRIYINKPSNPTILTLTEENPGPAVTLGRYVLNMAVCESLYAPLQIAEIALRNAIHRQLKVYIFILQK